MRNAASTSPRILSKRRVLTPPGRGLGIAVHRVAHPEHLRARGAHRADHVRQPLLDVLDAESMNEGQAARLVLRIQDLNQFLQPFGAHGRADLHADGIGDAAKIFDVRAVDIGGAHADPRHVRGQVVPVLLALDVARLRLLGQQMQPFVAGVEVAAGRGVHPLPAHRLEEIQRFGDRVDDLLIRVAQRRVAQEAQVPVLRVMQIGEAAVDQGAHEIQGERGALIAAQQQLRIRLALRRGEAGPIDVVAAIATAESRRRAFPCRRSAAWRTGRRSGRRG